MSTLAISPLGVYYQSRQDWLGSGQKNPAGTLTSLDWKAGTPLVISATAGKIEEAALSSNFVTDANDLIGITAEAFDGAYAADGSVPLQKTTVGVDLLAPGVAITGNLYYDGNGGSEETIAAADEFATCVLRKLTSGLYVFDKTTATTSKATFTIIRLLSEIGTVYGRVLAVPGQAFLAL